MPTSFFTIFLLLLAVARAITSEQGTELVRAAQSGVLHAMDWAQASLRLNKANTSSSSLAVALGDCVELYRDAEPRLARLVSGVKGSPNLNQNGGLLASWDAATAKADIVVSQDGSDSCKTINEAVAALARMGDNRPERAIIYVKSGEYNEKVEVGRDMKNLMFVRDGMDKTVVTGNQNVQDGASTLNSATFGVSGDGFWARDMTFENTAGPRKHQAVALRVSSDLSIFYRCSVEVFQDSLLVHSLRQFYRDCPIYGTIDFIFGDASVVFQNCDIFMKRPMDHQANMITAQGRDNSNENTRISIENSSVRPSTELVTGQCSIKTTKHQIVIGLRNDERASSNIIFKLLPRKSC
ncbi:hypothetical protein RJ639_043875 [Escallonia herrerae]|uniref:Pectinesterase n=1 Tax=Escallonia herrerae TaxID=1293975 RepID=A0AA88W9T0_9ASTE|nr:hypothetical protein RJ639_043875 [Escallonia herrerae]